MKQRPNPWQQVVMKYLGEECVWCGSKEKLHIHHIIPSSRGGKNEMANLEVVCVSCHQELHRQLNKVIPIFYNSPCHFCGKLVDRRNKLNNALCSLCRSKRDCKRLKLKRENKSPPEV